MQKQVILCQRATSNVLHVIIVAVLILYLSPHLLLSQGLGTVYGVVRDAVTGKPVTGATVSVGGRRAVTNSQGRYVIRDIPPSFQSNFEILGFRFTNFPMTTSFLADVRDGSSDIVQCTSANYFSYRNTEVSIRACQRTELNITLSQELLPGSLRLVLTWGAIPRDLDSELFVPSIGGNAPQGVNCCRHRGFINFPPFAYLDRDAQYGFGPETITIRQLFPGTYTYSVFNGTSAFEVSPEISSGPLEGCGAVVQIFNSTGLLHTITVPKTKEVSGIAQWWNVCSIDGSTGKISIINKITNQSTISSITLAQATPPAASLIGKNATEIQSVTVSSYRWNFGGGKILDRNPLNFVTVEFTTVGTYSVGLDVVKDSLKSSLVKTNYISNVVFVGTKNFYQTTFVSPPVLAGSQNATVARALARALANPTLWNNTVIYGTVADTLAKLYVMIAAPDTTTPIRISLPQPYSGSLSVFPDIAQQSSQATLRAYPPIASPFPFAVALYTPPQRLVNADGKNEITIPIAVTIGTRATQTIPLRLVRPPVILVHDIASRPSAWQQGFSAALEQSGYKIFYADYEGQNTEAFNPASSVASAGISAIQRAMEEARAYLREQGIEGYQVDILAHGMGGVFVRTFLPKEDRPSNGTQWGSVRRFITLGTPHGGSPLGTYLWSRREGRATATQSNAEVMTGLGFPLGAAYRSLGRGDSSLSLLRPMPETATHTIVSDWKPEATSALTNTNAFLRLLQTPDEYRTNTTPLDSIFQGRAHNMYADLASQRGGLAANNPAVTTFSGVAHGNMPFTGTSETLLSSPRVWRRITELLTTTASTSFVNGLPAPPEAWWNTAPNFIVRPAAIPAGSLRISQPQRGQTVFVDTLSSFTVRVEINGTAQVRDAVAMIEDVGMIPLSPSGTSSLTGTLTNLGNTRSIGRKRVTVIARDGQTGGQLVDTTSVMLQPRGELEDITVRPCFLTMEAGKTTGQQQMRVQALYGGIWYDVTGRQQGTVYTSTQAAVRVNSEGFVTAFGMTASTGSSQIVTVEHGGLQVRIPVQVSGILTSVRESAQRPSLGKSNTSFLLEVSPQPASNEITLRYILDYDTDVRFDVYDIRGQHCGGIEYGRQQRGQHTVLLSTHTLAQGTYLVRCTLSGSCCGQGIAPRLGAVLITIVK